jgi:hypothetical protein
MYTLQGITRPTRHTLPTLSPRMVQDHTYLMWSTYSNPSRDANRFRWIPLLPRKRGSRHNPQHTGWPIRGSVPNFSSEPTNEAGGVSQAPVGDQLLGLPGPYHRYAIDTFNTCSWGPTHRYLTDTGGGYILEGVGLPYTTPRPSQPVISTFHLGVLPGLQFNQVSSTKPNCWV